MTMNNEQIEFGIEDEETEFGIEESPSALINLEESLQGLPDTRSAERLEKGQRLWQTEAYNIWLGLYPNPRMTCEAGTGAGKTRLAITCMTNWLHVMENGVVVFIVSTKTLLKQTKEVVRLWGLTFARIGGGYNETAPHKDVYITTYDSFDKVMRLKHLQDRPTMLVLDECHRGGGRVALQKLRKHQGDACLLISATPQRSDGVCVMHEMNTAPEGSVCYGSECDVGIQYSLSLIEGIEQSRTADDELDYTFHVVHVHATPTEQLEYDEYTEKISKLYHKCYKLANETPYANPHNLFSRSNFGLNNELTNALNMYSNLTRKRKRLQNEMEHRFELAQQVLTMNIGRKFALFHETIFGIERLNGMCKDIGIHPHIYHSGITTLPQGFLETYPELNNTGFFRRLEDYNNNSEKELNRWLRSSSDALLTCKSLKEGFNAPDMQGLVMMTGTNNIRSRIQTIGRVFRGSGHKDIFMFVHGDTDSSEYKSFYRLIEKTGIPISKVQFHTNGINPAYIHHSP